VFSGREIVDVFEQLGVTHVVALPDSTLGRWEGDIRGSRSLRLVRVCREGEAWVIAAGLHLGGAVPLVMIQCTGLFESGDALRNVLCDYRLPLWAIIGYRSYLNDSTLPGDTARVFTEPVLRAWQLEPLLVDAPEKKPLISRHLTACRTADRPGIVLIAEGKA
jgi:sulfopyruvate decarboxylase subunit alpha